MFSSLTPGKRSLVARSHAGSIECLERKRLSPKHLRIILLRDVTTKCPGMIFLQDASIRSGRRKRSVWSNSIRICTLKEKHAQGMAGAKRFRMISLQNSSNKTLGIISLQKKVGGRGPFGARESHGHQELSLVRMSCHFPAANVSPRKGYQQDALFAARKGIRSFAALTKI